MGQIIMIIIMMMILGMVAYTKPQQWKKEESERLRGDTDQIRFIDLRFKRWQVVRIRKARRSFLCLFLYLFLSYFEFILCLRLCEKAATCENSDLNMSKKGNCWIHHLKFRNNSTSLK